MNENDDFLPGNEEDTAPSRSELKRQMLALQDLGERLLSLKESQWETLGFSETMLEALRESKRIKSQNAMRRHVRRLGKLLSKEDIGKVEQLFQRADNQAREERQRFHRLEQWRDRLVEGDENTLSKLLDICPNADRQRLRQLIRNSKKELELQKPPASQRKLFKYLREIGV
ncbi:MAG: DUF615 domain-containing protein [Sedimenticola sp.]|nr:DUF615 domain-containing protein [Sedimenticola sp.]